MLLPAKKLSILIGAANRASSERPNGRRVKKKRELSLSFSPRSRVFFCEMNSLGYHLCHQRKIMANLTLITSSGKIEQMWHLPMVCSKFAIQVIRFFVQCYTLELVSFSSLFHHTDFFLLRNKGSILYFINSSSTWFSISL